MEGEPSTETRLHSVGRNCDRSPQASAPSILFVQPEPDSELLILVGKPTTLECGNHQPSTLLRKRSKPHAPQFPGTIQQRDRWDSQSDHHISTYHYEWLCIASSFHMSIPFFGRYLAIHIN